MVRGPHAKRGQSMSGGKSDPATDRVDMQRDPPSEPREPNASDTESSRSEAEDETGPASDAPLATAGNGQLMAEIREQNDAAMASEAGSPEHPAATPAGEQRPAKPESLLARLFKRSPGPRQASLDDPNRVVEQARQSAFGSAARSLVLGLLLGISLVAWAQFSFDSRWLVEFLTKNRLDLGRRMTLISSMLGGGVVGVVGVAGLLGWSFKRKRAFADIERWLWFLSPLTLLPTLPVLLKYQAWEDNHDNLLPALLFVGLVLELFLFKCLRSVPSPVHRAWAAARSEVPALLRRHGPFIIVITAALAYTVFMSFYTIRWHHKLGTGNYDLGINNNLMFGGLYGDFNHSRIVFPHDPAQYIANHVKIGAYVFLPIYALAPRPETLQVIQSAALGLGSVPLFLFARRYLSAWMAALIALCWLAYYPIHGANFYEVKWVPVASVFVLTTIWAADARRWWIMGIAFAIGMLLREDMPVGFAIVGGFLLLSGHRPIAGLVMALVASAWFVLLRFYIMEEAGEWWFPKMYKDLWADGETGFRSVIKTLVSNPFFTLTHVLVEKKIIYAMHLLVPLLFLPARRWYLWASFLPGAILTLLVTDYKPVTMFSFQYVMHWAPYIFVAAVLALAAYRRENPSGANRAHAALGAVAFVVAVLSYNYGAFPARDGALKSGYHSITFSMSDEERERYAQLLDIISSIPPNASVAATEKTGPHVSSRRVFYSLRRDSYHADYLLARQKGLRLDRTKRVITDALASGEYGVYRVVGEFVLMKRGHSTAGNEDIIREWRLTRPRSPESEYRDTSRPRMEDAGDADEPDTDMANPAQPSPTD